MIFATLSIEELSIARGGVVAINELRPAKDYATWWSMRGNRHRSEEQSAKQPETLLRLVRSDEREANRPLAAHQYQFVDLLVRIFFESDYDPKLDRLSRTYIATEEADRELSAEYYAEYWGLSDVDQKRLSAYHSARYCFIETVEALNKFSIAVGLPRDVEGYTFVRDEVLQIFAEYMAYWHENTDDDKSLPWELY